MGGWSWDYVMNFGNYIDWIRIFTDGYIVLSLLMAPDNASTSLGFLCVFATSTFYKWVKILYALTPFRRFGLSVLPILHTLLDIGPFSIVLMFHILGLMHGYFSLCIPGKSFLDVVLIVYRLGLLADFEMEEMDGGEEDYYLIVRIAFLAVALSITVTLMNTFIAALGNSFNHASNRMEILFQARRADCSLQHMAARDGIQQLLGRKPKHAGEGLQRETSSSQLKQSEESDAAHDDAVRRTGSSTKWSEEFEKMNISSTKRSFGHSQDNSSKPGHRSDNSILWFCCASDWLDENEAHLSSSLKPRRSGLTSKFKS